MPSLSWGGEALPGRARSLCGQLAGRVRVTPRSLQRWASPGAARRGPHDPAGGQTVAGEISRPVRTSTPYHSPSQLDPARSWRQHRGYHPPPCRQPPRPARPGQQHQSGRSRVGTVMILAVPSCLVLPRLLVIPQESSRVVAPAEFAAVGLHADPGMLRRHVLLWDGLTIAHPLGRHSAHTRSQTSWSHLSAAGAAPGAENESVGGPAGLRGRVFSLRRCKRRFGTREQLWAALERRKRGGHNLARQRELFVLVDFVLAEEKSSRSKS